MTEEIILEKINLAVPLTQQTAQNIMSLEGETRGATFKTDSEFILKEKGKEGLEKVEAKLVELGFPVKYKEIETMKYYPIGFRFLSLLAMRDVFNFSEEDIFKMGSSAPKISLVIRMFFNLFPSKKRTFDQLPNIWRKHFTIGKLLAIELDEEKKYVVVRLEGFKFFPFYCNYLRGYFLTVVKMIVNSPTIIEETKCSFRGDEYHEYLFKWQ